MGLLGVQRPRQIAVPSAPQGSSYAAVLRDTTAAAVNRTVAAQEGIPNVVEGVGCKRRRMRPDHNLCEFELEIGVQIRVDKVDSFRHPRDEKVEQQQRGRGPKQRHEEKGNPVEIAKVVEIIEGAHGLSIELRSH
eukprot:473594-Prymnesium_polylepis.2